VKPYFEKAGILVTDEKLRQVTPLIQERLVTLDEAPEKGGFFFQAEVAPEPSDLVIKGLTPDQSVEIACRSLEILKNTSDFSHENAETPLRALAEEFGLSAGQVFGLLRVAITGQTVSPPLLESMTVIGKETVLNRLHQAVDLLSKMK
jgi:glutamyl-tRNA synthetase